MINVLSRRLLLASPARAQNPVVPGQRPLRRLSAPTGPASPAAPDQVATGSHGLDSLRTLSGRYKALETNEKTLVLFDITAGLTRPRTAALPLAARFRWGRPIGLRPTWACLARWRGVYPVPPSKLMVAEEF